MASGKTFSSVNIAMGSLGRDRRERSHHGMGIMGSHAVHGIIDCFFFICFCLPLSQLKKRAFALKYSFSNTNNKSAFFFLNFITTLID